MCVTVLRGGREPIFLGRSLLSHAKAYLKLDRRVLIVTDDGVPEAYWQAVALQCREPVVIVIPQGEQSKDFSQLQRLLSALVQGRFSRGDCIVAVGGGVVGDLSGFAASCYMRGIDFYNLPTTLLAQMDSSIGGKTAIDFEGIKNIVGSFYPPRCVLIDPAVLETLSARQLRAGLAEAVKIAAVRDEALFCLLEALPTPLDSLTDVIERAILNKLEVVAADPLEHGTRRILNFGHTVGHAIESCGGGALLHGECVALGMLPMCSPAVRARLIPLLERLGLSTRINIDPQALTQFLIHDKKAQADVIHTVLVEEIGRYVLRDLSPAELLCRIKECI